LLFDRHALFRPATHEIHEAKGNTGTWKARADAAALFVPSHVKSVMSLILLQKSKVASVRIFGETLKREPVDDSDYLSRATEVAYEFCLRRSGPSDLYTKTAPAALRIFDSFGKTTFATLSASKRTLYAQG
jgi:hypothetical protein